MCPGYRDQIVTMLHSVMWVCLCIPGHIHYSYSTIMALLCIPLSEHVSFAFSICPILIQRIFSFTCHGSLSLIVWRYWVRKKLMRCFKLCYFPEFHMFQLMCYNMTQPLKLSRYVGARAGVRAMTRLRRRTLSRGGSLAGITWRHGAGANVVE